MYGLLLLSGEQLYYNTTTLIKKSSTILDEFCLSIYCVTVQTHAHFVILRELATEESFLNRAKRFFAALEMTCEGELWASQCTVTPTLPPAPNIYPDSLRRKPQYAILSSSTGPGRMPPSRAAPPHRTRYSTGVTSNPYVPN